MASAAKPKRKLIKQPNGGALLAPYKKGESGNPAGGKKSQLTLIREAFEIEYDWKLSKHDAEQLLKMLVFAPKEELHKLAANPSTPTIVLNYIHALFADIKAGRINAAKDIVEFSFGRATQKIEVDDKRDSQSQVFTRDKILLTMRQFCEILNLDDLKEFEKMFKEVVLQKKAQGAKIINQSN
jgi:hypothetical protein